jgi:hypothetical protein
VSAEAHAIVAFFFIGANFAGGRCGGSPLRLQKMPNKIKIKIQIQIQIQNKTPLQEGAAAARRALALVCWRMLTYADVCRRALRRLALRLRCTNSKRLGRY